MKSERLFLRPVTKNDVTLYQKSTEDEEIRYMTGTPRAYSIEEIEAHIERITQDDSREDFAICLNDSKEMIGEMSLLDIDEVNHSAGFRISMVTTDHVGKGLGTEAMNLMVHYVFEGLNLNRLQLEVFSHNKRGIRAYEKVGFIKEGVLRQALFYNNQYSDEIIMSIIKDDYKTW